MSTVSLAVMTFAGLCLAAVIMIAAVIRQLRAAAREADEEHSDYQPPARTKVQADFIEKE